MRFEATVNDPMIPYSDQVYNGMLLGDEYANYSKALESGSEAEKDEASRGISRLIVQANTEGWWYTGETMDRPVTEPDPITRVDDDDSPPRRPRKMVRFDDNEPVLDNNDLPPIIAEPVIVTDPAFDENESDWKMVKTLKGHARNMDALKQENKKLVEKLFGIGLVAGVGAVVLNAEISKALIEGTDLVNAPWLLKFLIGSTSTVIGSWVLNQKLFLDNAIRKWLAPRLAEGHIKNELKKQAVVDVGGAILESRRRDTEERITSTVVLGDITGKMIGAGVELVASVGSHLISTARHSYVPEGARPDYTLDNGQLDLPSDHVYTNGSHLNGDEGGLQELGIESPVPMHIGTEVVTPDVPGSEILSAGEYIVKGPSEMLTEILSKNGAEVYSLDYIDMLKLNRDAFAEMFKKAYEMGQLKELVSLPDNFNNLTPEQALANLDKVIARGYPDATTGDYRQQLTDMFNAVRYLVPGTKLRLLQP